MKTKIVLPVSDELNLKTLKAGDLVGLSGTLYTARDQAHKKIVDLIRTGKELPFDPKGNFIYYCGPTPARQDGLFGSAGPTTSSRMDEVTIPLFKAGLKGCIGKGGRSEKILAACRDYGAVYLVTFGGAGAVLAGKIRKQETAAFPELGTEAVYRLEVVDFPVVVAFDTAGNSIFS